MEPEGDIFLEVTKAKQNAVTTETKQKEFSN